MLNTCSFIYFDVQRREKYVLPVSFITVGTSKKVLLAFDGLTVETLYETPVCHSEGVFIQI